ncbi:MAG: phosphoribosyltransferase family protein [Actinomycetaceae bacterium]|nr:phosphoribosyltransferase family protein [Actinomycetaceae bacterium]
MCQVCRQSGRQISEVSAGLLVDVDIAVWALGAYCGSWRRIILAAKHRKVPAALKLIEECGYDVGKQLVSSEGCNLVLSGARADNLEDTQAELWVVPAPSHRRGRSGMPSVAQVFALGIARGYARGVEENLVSRVRVVDLLSIKPGVTSQAGLGGKARARNRAETMSIKGNVKDVRGSKAHLVFVDDVLASGATLAEALRVLELNDLSVLTCAVLAASSNSGRKDSKDNLS